MKNIYVFGNEYLEGDNFSYKVVGELKENKEFNSQFNIIFCRDPDILMEVDDNEIIILDVVKDIKEPVLINNVSRIKTRNLISLHDFDLGFFLNLMKEMGINKKIKIIGVPQEGDIKKIADKIETFI